MIVTMLAMIHLFVHVRGKNQIIRGSERVFTGKIMYSLCSFLPSSKLKEVKCLTLVYFDKCNIILS
jgi:hypothetical protein